MRASALAVLTMDALPDRIDALLPQTQCTKCGFDGCRPYAEAIAQGRAEINRCPPGGAAGIAALAALLARAPLPLDPSCGVERDLRVARIDETLCIGCTKCITACPVDAIIGAGRRMHTVIQALCTGCDLCLPVCPVDCIEMHAQSWRPPWSAQDAAAARGRNQRRRARIERERQDGAVATGPDSPAQPHAASEDEAARVKRAVIEAAMRRAQQRLAGQPPRVAASQLETDAARPASARPASARPASARPAAPVDGQDGSR